MHECDTKDRPIIRKPLWLDDFMLKSESNWLLALARAAQLDQGSTCSREKKKQKQTRFADRRGSSAVIWGKC